MPELDVYLRPLRIEDAKVSWRWRNNPEVWRNTGSAPTCHVTEEMEMAWAAKAVSNPSIRRYAICIRGSDRYIGNAYLGEFKDDSAVEEIFIGEPDLWGKGLGTKARAALYEIGRREYGVKTIFTNIRTRNVASLRSALKLGFREVTRDVEWVRLRKELLDSDGAS